MTRPARLTILRLAALGVAALGCVGIATLAAGRIEARTESGLQTAMAEAGHDWVSVAADGTTATLTGTAPDEAERFRAMTIAGDRLTPANLIDGIKVAQADPVILPDYRIEILRSGDAMTIHGLVPGGTDAQAALTADLQNRIAGISLSDLLTASATPAPDDWGPAVAVGLLAAERLKDARIAVTPGKVAVEGLADSQSLAGIVTKALEEKAAEGGVTLEIDLKQPRPVVSPFIARFRIDAEGGRFDACSAETLNDRDLIVAAGRRAGATLDAVDCVIGIGAPDPQWTSAATTAIAALADLGEGSVTISDLTVILVSADGTDPEKLSEITMRLEDDLPPLFRLTVLGAATRDTGTDQSPANVNGTSVIFTATRSPDGQVELQGPIGDRQGRAMVESYSDAVFGASATETLRQQPDLPNGWLLRILGGLEAFAKLESGKMTITPAAVRIEGTSGSEDTSDAIIASLTQTLGQDAFFTVDVTYDEALDPTAALPTPQECVEQVNAILADEKITFGPGSVDLDGAALRIVGRIANVLQDCPQVAMEISGHTDSQGSAEMNAALSQQRADAVFNALMARRVLLPNFNAKGYGEEQPIADNDTEDGREANRRIEFRLLEDEMPAEAAEADAETTPGEDPATTEEAQDEATDGQN